MDFSWMPHFGLFWIFPLLCLLFMAFMVLGCGGMLSRFSHGGRHGEERETPRQILDRRYANGQINKEQYDTMRRDLQGYALD